MRRLMSTNYSLHIYAHQIQRRRALCINRQTLRQRGKRKDSVQSLKFRSEKSILGLEIL